MSRIVSAAGCVGRKGPRCTEIWSIAGCCCRLSCYKPMWHNNKKKDFSEIELHFLSLRSSPQESSMSPCILRRHAPCIIRRHVIVSTTRDSYVRTCCRSMNSRSALEDLEPPDAFLLHPSPSQARPRAETYPPPPPLEKVRWS